MSEVLRIPAQEKTEESDATQRLERGADAGFLWDFWYPAVRSSEIRGRALVKAMLLEVPLVLGRTDEGKPFAMRDSCPHRGIPLSYGHFDGATVECSYHGWRFDACTARCVEIPSLTSQDKLKVERIFAGHYPCEERDGYVWVYVNAPGSRLAESVPAAPSLPVFSAGVVLAFLISLALFIPVNMAMWFASALVILQGHSAPRARWRSPRAPAARAGALPARRRCAVRYASSPLPRAARARTRSPRSQR